MPPSEAITFGPAEERPKKVIAGVAGGTGAGKSFSALELGTGLVSDPARHLFLIDTEFGRGAHYATQFAFQYGQLSPPFRPQNYIDAIDAAIKGGAECVIVDSLSHMWEGEAGLLDWHGDIALKMAKGDEQRAETYNFPAWRLPKQELQKFVLYLQRCPVHLILCLRAKPKSKMVKVVKDGRTVNDIVDAGLQPIIDTATPYEATFLAMLSQEEPGVPHWTHKALASYLQPLFADGPKTLSREHGRRLAAWCGNDTSAATASADRAGNGGKAKVARDRFFASLEKVTDFAGAAELDKKLRTSQGLLGEHYSECVNALQGKLDALRGDGRTFADDIAELEPDEWKTETGRVEDDRQEEML